MTGRRAGSGRGDAAYRVDVIWRMQWEGEKISISGVGVCGMQRAQAAAISMRR
jgi:hypothetical protein